VFSFCRQINGCDGGTDDFVLATKGQANIQRHVIEPTGEPKWKYDGPAPVMYQQEHNELFQAIRSGKTINQGEQMAYSTLMGIMGRMAGYTGKKVTWQQALNSKEDLMPKDLDMKGSLPFPEVARPGKTKLL
jgi:hypothetical protein